MGTTLNAIYLGRYADTALSLAPVEAGVDASGSRRDEILPEFACFAADVLIRTPTADMRVVDLQVDDMVLTLDHGPQPIRWIGQATVDLKANGKLRPVRIRAGALGDGMPQSDLLVSPQHRILVRSETAQRMFGTDEVLVAAKQLTMLDGVDLVPSMDSIVYVHFLCDAHQIVWSNGALTESLFTSPDALKGIGPAAREEIFEIFPDLRDATTSIARPAARPLVPRRQARRMIERHAENGKHVVT